MTFSPAELEELHDGFLSSADFFPPTPEPWTPPATGTHTPRGLDRPPGELYPTPTNDVHTDVADDLPSRRKRRVRHLSQKERKRNKERAAAAEAAAEAILGEMHQSRAVLPTLPEAEVASSTSWSSTREIDSNEELFHEAPSNQTARAEFVPPTILFKLGALITVVIGLVFWRMASASKNNQQTMIQQVSGDEPLFQPENSMSSRGPWQQVVNGHDVCPSWCGNYPEVNTRSRHDSWPKYILSWTSMRLNNSLRKTSIPGIVPPDMQGGLESKSCELAEAFYKRYSAMLLKHTTRAELSDFYIDTYPTWCPVHLRNHPRHFKQVLYCLAHHGKVLKVIGGLTIKWSDTWGSAIPRRESWNAPSISPGVSYKVPA